MGAQVGNTRLAGDAAARLREAASQGIQMRRSALQNRGLKNEGPPPGAKTPNVFGGGSPDVSLPRTPEGATESGFSEQGSPVYDQMMERIRNSNPMKNAGSNF
jgi:hypothetical protein